MSRSGSAASASTPVPSHDPDAGRSPAGAVLAGRHRISARPPPQLSRPGALDQPGHQGTPLQVRSLRRAHPSRGLGRRDAAPRPRRRRPLFGNHDLGPVRRLDHAPGDARTGTKCCGTQSGPSARRAARVDTGRARHVDDAPRPPRALGAGRSRFVVMVAAPTNPSGTGRPSSPSMAGIGLQIVILGGRQHAGGERWPRPDFSCGAMRCGARACPAGCGCCCAGRRCHRPRHLNSSRGRPRRSPSRPRAQ